MAEGEWTLEEVLELLEIFPDEPPPPSVDARLAKDATLGSPPWTKVAWWELPLEELRKMRKDYGRERKAWIEGV